MSVCTNLNRTRVRRQQKTETTVSLEYIYLVYAINVHKRNLALSYQGPEHL